jgi:hypothetical protein
MSARTAKAYYSETEAARFLGISITQFRDLVRRHIIDREEDMNNMEVTTFHAADLLLLKMLATHAIPPNAARNAEPQPQHES